MSGTEWLVVLASAGAIAWVNWYFFVAERSAATAVAGAPGAASAAGDAGVAQVTVVVEGGYSPSTIRVKAGEPVRLIFDRRETSSCSEEVVFPDFGIRRFLPTGQRTTIEVTPPRAGNYGFTCGMSMLRGTLVAE